MAKPKRNDKEQSKRFIEKARELGGDESGEEFERAFKKVVPTKQPSTPKTVPDQE